MSQTKTIKTLQAEEYQQHIPLFLNNHPTGRIHSVFKNGFNISMGEKLFFIGTTKNGTLPFGIHLNQLFVKRMLPNLNMNTAVTWDIKAQQLHFSTMPYVVCFPNGKGYETKIKKTEVSDQSLSNQLVAMLIPLLESNITTGLGCNIEQFMMEYVENKPSHKESEQYVYRLMDGFYLEDRRKLEHVLRYFIGRGQGLTPSGDDLLVGALAVDAATNTFSSVFTKQLEDLVVYENLTTDVGKEYLIYAVKGEFSSSVSDVIDALLAGNKSQINNTVRELLSVGHSSGADTVFGILIGVLALRRRMECQKK